VDVARLTLDCRPTGRHDTDTPGGTALSDDDASASSPPGPFSVLQRRDFLWFAGSRFFSGAGQTLLQAAIAWQVYAISGSALQLGLIGIARFVPSLGMSLVGGAVADTYNRRNILLIAQTVPLLSSAVLLTSTVGGWVSLPLIYALVLLIAFGSAFENPSRQSMLPLLVPREMFANAVAVNSTIQQLSFVGGPAVGGLVIGVFGIGAAYGVHVGLLALAMLALIPLRPRQVSTGRSAISLRAMKEGVSFVAKRQVLLGAMAIDMFGVLFAGATAMLPIYANDILGVGPKGYGLLTAAQGVGAFVTSLTMVMLPPVQRTGRVLLVAVAGFGLATIVFALSRSFPLSLAAYALTGVADQVSVVMRQTTIQLSTPDELRGRVSAVSMVFIGASNQLNMAFSGFVATLTSATFAVASGGVGCLAVVALIAVLMPELRRHRIDLGRPATATAPAPAVAAVREQSRARR
jgi:MFS family permease